MTAPAIRAHPCPHCGLPAPDGLRAHLECVMNDHRAQVTERVTRERTAEAREERARIDAAAAIARRLERERIEAVIRTLRAEYRTLAQQATEPGGLASTLASASQRATALDELLTRLEGCGE